MTKLTDEEIEQLIELEKKATAGRWIEKHLMERVETEPDNSNGHRVDPIFRSVYCEEAYDIHHKDDFIFIAKIRNAAPQLLQELKQLRIENADLQTKFNLLQSLHDKHHMELEELRAFKKGVETAVKQKDCPPEFDKIFKDNIEDILE